MPRSGSQKEGKNGIIRPRKDREGIVIGYQVQRKGYPSQTKTFRSKTDAQAWATIIESQMQRGVWRDRSESERATLAEALDRYAEEIIPSKKAPSVKVLVSSPRGKRTE